ncbi:hypothetical protein CXB51_000516 [Gossypium anomalum]|uniref:Rab-GAP TBC domain-containing protein n=1 Tax=Gossypium anomalum TaxID=47600 RepID=A0A8J6DEM0_9ROSI|nr:hypothetical protein CXB51_000516 [Gossypium anomalum]
MRGAPSEPADSYYEVRPDSTDVPATRFRIKAGKTLSVRKWQAAFSSDGQLDIGKTLNRIHRGGIHPAIRGEVWEFLLGCYHPMSTFDERKQIRQHRRAQYVRLKNECSKMFPVVGSGKYITAPVITEDGQPIRNPVVALETNLGKTEMAKELTSNGPLDMKVVQWMHTLHQIGLDVKRTDRTLLFYDKPENLSKLWDILSRGNFQCTETFVGVQTQLSNLATVTQVIDPKLHQHLETLGGGNYLFAFRMLMVLFRREFSFCDSLYLWEMMWALEYDPDLFSLYEELELNMEKAEGSKGKSKPTQKYGKYERENMKIKSVDAPLPISVFLVASVLKDKSSVLLHQARGLDDVVKILNDMTGNLDAKKACTGALKLHKKYVKVLLFHCHPS